ncbi:MAG TPA: glycosyltransferase [Yinghuangia sp.]|nr:glycosyltransferase [Yinghuangia sp.]
MNILLWHVHGSWTTSFVQGSHRYLLPVLPDRGPEGIGRARTWEWPDRVVEVPAERLRDQDVDVVVLQRPHEYELVRDWLGRTPGVDVPSVFLEHNAPDGDVPLTPHPMRDRPNLPIVHVTHFNSLMWDCGSAPTTVVEHGIVDPGARWTGDIGRCAVVVNEPIRRGRHTGTDLLPDIADALPLDVFGMRVEKLAEHLGLALDRCRTYEDHPQDRMHDALARRAVYLHPMRWTSLGLSLLEAMHLGMPVVAVASTEAARAIPPGAGTVTASTAELREAVRHYAADRAAARAAGAAARDAALARYGLARFLSDWDAVLKEAVS